MTVNATLPRRPTHGWTYADYCRIPEDRKRHEIIDGRHYVTPSPDFDHQLVSARLHHALMNAIDDRGLGIVLSAPMDVHLGLCTVVQPDLIAIRRTNVGRIREKKIRGAPDLVVEILSPSSQRRDRRLKRLRYERAGVREYWVVDPDAHELEQHVLVRGKFAPAVDCSDRVDLRAFRGVAIDLAGIL